MKIFTKLGKGIVLMAPCFLSDVADFGGFNEVYAKYFSNNPARSCVAVKTLPQNALCEIETIAGIKEEVKHGYQTDQCLVL